MTKDCIPIREVAVSTTANESLNIVDYSYRAIARRVAEQYVKKNAEQDEKIDNWMLNLCYFFLGAFVWEFIPVFTTMGVWVGQNIIPIILTLFI